MTAATLALLFGGGALIGFLLAVLGAGGSIVLLPLLVSGAGLPTREAVPLSLIVVGVLALATMPPYLRRGLIAPRPALVLGLPALAGSWIGGSLVKAGLISETVQLALFASAAVLAAWLLSRRSASPAATVPLADDAGGATVRLAVQGVLVGLLTGIAGVGGGFAIVPALVLLAGLSMTVASGTSLLLIAFNALVALVAVGHWPAPVLSMLIPLLLGGVAGGWAGRRIAPHLPERRLRQGFAVLLLSSAILTGFEAWRRQGPLTEAGGSASVNSAADTRRMQA
ncbi:MAG: sulfite exporter TauE/SafE family protein [Cyanobacteria bacterium J06638_7]